MNQVLKIDQPGVFKTVDEAALEAETLLGWQLVAVIQDVHDCGPSNLDFETGQTVSQPLAGTLTSYLLRKDDDSVLTEHADARQKAEKEAEELKAQLKESQATERKLADTLSSREDSLEWSRQQGHDLKNQLEEARTRGSRMEEDLGKLRKAIGELRMREILEGGGE